MAKFFLKEKRKRAICALSVALCASLPLAMFSACGGTETDTSDEEETTPSVTDTQVLKNGNFEFYAEQLEELNDKRNFISTPTNWSLTSGSPSSNTRSGVVETKEWEYMATQGREFTSVSDAYEHWNDEDVHLYDRLQFLDKVTKKEADGGFKETYDALSSSSPEKKLFSEYSYSVDFEDVEDLHADFENGVSLHARAEDDEETGTSLLMIHNDRDTDGVLGTGQYYTSSTTITLAGGTAAKITGWVMTDHLYHYYSSDKLEVNRRGGAYIGVINTVGGSTLDEMQIKNINTHGEWAQYELYVRASTYASTTFRIKLGLGQGSSSDNRYENVNGYAFFDDFAVEKITTEEYLTATADADGSCTVNSKKNDKLFDVSDPDSAYLGATKFALDLYGTQSFEGLTLIDGGDASEGQAYVGVDLTKEISGSNTYESKIPDNRSTAAPERQSIVGVYSYSALSGMKETNGYLSNIFDDDFDGHFPFYKDGTAEVNDEMPVLFLLSTNGAAYTAKMTSPEFTVGKTPLLVSFFVKTSDIRAGKTGAGITLVDEAGTRTSISAFNSHSVDTVDIDEDDPALTDIYKGWVQCFFFVTNDSYDEVTGHTEKTFRLEFTFGPTSVATADSSDYAQGYAAFTDFRFSALTPTQYSYATTGDRAKKVSLTAAVANTTKFDDYQASADIEHDLSAPANFTGKLAGSKVFVDDEEAPENVLPEAVYAGLLNYDYRTNYETVGDPWMTKLQAIASGSAISEGDWWKKVFGDVNNTAIGSQQPLVFLNTGDAAASYGYVSANATLSANSSRRIGLRVKLGEGTTVNVYLFDTEKASETKLLAPAVPQVTFWYDKNGNITKSDPAAKDYDAETGVAFYREDNGLYTKAGATGETKYYANLSNYDVDENGNYVTREETPVIAFYNHDGKVYAYRTETGIDTYEYDTEVADLLTAVDDKSILRYEYPADQAAYDAKITLTGDAAHKDTWTDVAFYLRTGSKAKNYRVEIWIGDRDNKTDGIPAGAYAFFDTYNGTGTISDYDAQQKEFADLLLQDEGNRADDPENAGQKLEDRLNSSLALYYTYTLYDAADFLRYDATTDEDGVNWWGSYDQSSYTEKMIWLRADDEDGAIAGGKLCSLWLDYSAVDNTVAREEADENTDSGTDTDTSTDSGDTNIWLFISSALLAVVLLFAIVAVIVRMLGKRFRRSPKPAAKKRPRKPAKRASEEVKPADGEGASDASDAASGSDAPTAPDGNPYDE